MELEGLVISQITRVGDIGEPGYSVYGESLPACKKKANARRRWHGATQLGLSSVFPQSYITQGVYDFLTAGERESIRNRVRGIVPNRYYKMGTCPYYPQDPGIVFAVSVATPMPTKDPCADVECGDTCVGVDMYDQVCKDGVCVRGALIGYNSERCGFRPEPEPEPSPTPSPDPQNNTYLLIGLVLVGLYTMLRR